MNLRASQGGEQVIALPAQTEVIGVSRNGEALNLRAQDGKLSLPVIPGSQRFELRLRQEVAATLRRCDACDRARTAGGEHFPSCSSCRRIAGCSRPAAPASGPAVLYWSELALMLLIAFALARTRRTPLKLWQWILLGLGFSMFSWIALLVVAAWLFALDWRARTTLASARTFNLLQLGLAALTVAAMLCLVASVQQGLLGTPDMHVAGNASSAYALRWFADRSADALPIAHAFSVPLWIYKLAMLAWALWLASALVGWLAAASPPGPAVVTGAAYPSRSSTCRRARCRPAPRVPTAS